MWQPIETAPKHTEVLVYREDSGVFMAQYTDADTFLREDEAAEIGLTEDDQFEMGWFSADTYGQFRMDGDLAPTHWMPLPDGPSALT